MSRSSRGPFYLQPPFDSIIGSGAKPESEGDRELRARIMAPPDGEAPLDVRQAWVGLTLPLTQWVNEPVSARVSDIETERSALERLIAWLMRSGKVVRGYRVAAPKAFAILANRRPQAYHWWAANLPQMLRRHELVFEESCCDVRTTAEWLVAITEELQAERGLHPDVLPFVIDAIHAAPSYIENEPGIDEDRFISADDLVYAVERLSYDAWGPQAQRTLEDYGLRDATDLRVIVAALGDAGFLVGECADGESDFEGLGTITPREHDSLKSITACGECGYDIRGLQDPRCPECGTEFEPDDETPPGET